MKNIKLQTLCIKNGIIKHILQYIIKCIYLLKGKRPKNQYFFFNIYEPKFIYVDISVARLHINKKEEHVGPSVSFSFLFLFICNINSVYIISFFFIKKKKPKIKEAKPREKKKIKLKGLILISQYMLIYTSLI